MEDGYRGFDRAAREAEASESVRWVEGARRDTLARATVARTGSGFALNALGKPCAVAFGFLVALIGRLADEPLLVPLGIASYLLLSVIAYFTLYEAETIGARERSGAIA